MKLPVGLLGGLVAAAGLLPQFSLAAAFNAGDLAVYRVGDGSAAVTSAATAAFIDEYTTAGTLVQSLPLPTAASAPNLACTNSGTATTEGLATLSADGAYLVGGCYATVPGTASITGSSAATIPRVIFRIDSSGSIDTATGLTDTASGGNPRGAASTNGTDLWATSSSGGVRYVPLHATSSVQLNSTSTNLRGVAVYGGQLYISSGASTIRLAAVGSGTPTTGSQTLTQLNGVSASGTHNAFALLDLSPTVAGVDTLYIADEGAGITKYSFDGTTWTAKGTVGAAADTYRGLTAVVSGSNVNLYAIRKSADLVSIVDTSGFAGTFTATPAVLASADTNKAFRSVSFAPASATAPPAPTLTVTAPASIPEGNSGTSTATFTVSLDSPAPAGGVSFTIDTQDGSASAGSDYVAISAASGSIAANASSTTIDVTINGDTVHEGDETFLVKLSNIQHTANSTASVIATITDDDPAPTISVADATVIEGNSGTATANFAVTLSNPSATDVTFTAQTMDGTATTADNDYVALDAATITIPARSVNGTVQVIVNGDTNIEPDENFSLLLSNASGGTLANTSATGTIQNDDSVTPTISINNVTQAEGDSGTSNFTFTVSSNVNAPAPDGYTVSIATADGTATAGEDYVATPPAATVTIPAGMSSVQFAVVVNGDRKIEPNETFSVTLSNAPAGTQLGTAVGIGTIVNDDAAPALSVANASISEGDSGTQTLNFTVHLSSPATQGGVQFDVATADGTATTSDHDYVANALAGQTIAEGQQDFTFAVTINGDTTFEPDETFSVRVTNIVGASNAGATVTATGTILNDDSKPTLSVADASVIEGNSGTNPALFTATLSSPAPTGGVTFKINTADGSATVADHDYVAVVNATGTIAAGATSTTFTVTVNSDAIVEPNETFTVNISAITNAGNTTASATGTILNDDDLSIMEIQGHGTTSPFNGRVVTTARNVVTAMKSNGFFMQDPYGDGDPTTSDGIFVFTSTAPTVLVGNEVTVTGTVQEFSGSTEISGSLTVTVTNATAPRQPVAYVLDDSPPTNDPTTGICMGRNSTIDIAEADVDGYQASNFACLDGMLVTMNDGTVTGATFGNSSSDGVHTGTPTGMYAMVGGGPRPFRGPGAQYPGIAGHPEIPLWGGEPEVIEIYYPGLAFDPTSYIYDAGTHFRMTGVLQGFKASGATSPIYEIYPYSMTTLTPAPTYPQPVSDSAAGTLTIGSQNLLHFFNDTADGHDTSGYNDKCGASGGPANGSSDTCPTTSEYHARVAKWTRQICDVLKAPVVMDIEEIENIAVARDLAASIQAVPPTGIGCGVSYQPYLIPGNDVSGINIGILVRSDVSVASVTQMYVNTMTSNCSSGSSCLLNDRPPVLMDATWNGYRFALLAIYDRSLSGLGDPTKPYIGPKRAEQAAQIASIAQAWQTGATLAGAGDARQSAAGVITPGPFDIVGDASVPLIVAGDFNAYEFSDGYADVTGMIMGTAVKAQNLYWYDGSAANTDTPAYVAPTPTLVDSGIKSEPASHYSYNFSGFAQEIDHILLSRAAWADFVSISNAHGDADVSEASSIILDSTTAARSGDHDGQVLTIAIDRIFADGSDPQP